MGFHNLVNTDQFSYTARDFKKNGDKYTLAPIGSREYQEFWDLEELRCQKGMTIGGTWITGRHYFYLNFTPIMKVDDKVALKAYANRGTKKLSELALTADRLFGFPRFYEIDYEWYRFKHIAWNGGTFMGIESPGGKHMCCGKTRGAGFSYKEASDGVYNFNFVPGSKSYYFAGIEQYLTTDGILNKVQPMLDFINDYSPEWKQNRQKKNTIMHQRASYLDAFSVERGSMAEIIGVVIDDPDKTRGKRGKKIVFEEAGSFKNLKKALGVSQGSIKDGDIYVGQISLFGTGGEEGPDIEGLEDIFEDPTSFDMLEFPNIYEDGMEGTSCGYFVPVFRTKSTFMDENGNVDMQAAVESEKKIRAKKKKAKDPKVLDGWKAEYPFKPSEMFNRHTKNSFDVEAVKAQIKNIENNQAIQQMIRHGNLVRGESGVVFVPKPKSEVNPIELYPHAQKEDLTGCVTIVARPFKDQKGFTPDGMYQITVDPYYKEESEDLTSLFSVMVWKQYNRIDPVDEGLPIAWYDARPQQLETAYKNLFMLADMYNATIQSEIAGGGQGIVDYAKMTKQLHRLEFEPEMMGNKEYTSSAAQKNKSIFMNMPTEKKRLGMTYLVNWHTQQRGASAEGNPILNIHRLYHIGFLREMAKYNKDRNADRISSAIVGMFMLKENAYREEKRVKTNRGPSFYNKPLFGNGSNRASQTKQTTSFSG